MHCFITGTSTDVGKTYVTRLMLEALVSAGHRAIAYKPICCGSRDDATSLLSAGTPGPTLEEINPLYLQAATAPHVAAQLENKIVEIEPLVDSFRQLAARYDHILVEGAGGWEVPIAPGQSVADLAVALGLPVLVVVDNRLGALNHTILTVNAIRARGLTCVGMILNHLNDARDTASITNRATLEDWLGIPVLQDILHEETSTDVDWILEMFQASNIPS